MDEDAETHLQDLVARALELRDAGEPDWLDRACAGAPALARRVRDAVEDSSKLHGVFSEAAGPDPHRGQVLGGRFRVLARLGSGAMGVVYRALDLTLRREVAVKVLRGGLVPTQELAARFAREAEAMASVRHPSVIAVYDRGASESGEPFIVMELVDGESLATIVDELQGASRSDAPTWLYRALGIAGRADSRYVPTVVGWVAELAAGLAAVHSAGVLHRDIKPSNVLIRRDGRPVLLDFGIALLDQDSTLTRGATSVGTPAYMPPESLQRGGKRTPASDLYSLAATLHHLLALRPPYEGTPSEVLAALATREPKPASAYCGGLPRDLQAILDKGMARQPDARYGSADALRSDLVAYLEHRPVSARPVSRWTRWWRRASRSRALQGAAGVLLVIGAATVVRAIHTHRSEARAVERFEVLRRFPPNFTLLDPGNRVCEDPVERATIEDLLQRALDLGAGPIPVQLLRASFRLDHGELDLAVADMNDVAAHVGTPFLNALAAAYAALPRGGVEASPTVPDLPPDASALDRYVYAYHIVRRHVPGKGVADALELFSAPDVRAIPHAEELRVGAVPLANLPPTEVRQRAFQLHEDLLALESVLGGRTATTAHLMGAMGILLGRYDEAREVLAEGIALCGFAHTLRINAGRAALGAGDVDASVAHYEYATARRPQDQKSLEGLVVALTAAGEFDEAERRIRSAPIPDSPRWRRDRELASIGVATQHALWELAAGVDAKAPLARAVALRDALATQGPLRDNATLVLLRGLESGQTALTFQGLMTILLQDPLNGWILKDALRFLPEDAGPAETQALRSLLELISQRYTALPR